MVSTKENNIIDIRERIEAKREDEEFEREVLALVKNQVRKRAIEIGDEFTQEEIQRLKKEVTQISNKLEKSFPTALVIFMCVFLSGAIISLGLFVLQIKFDFKLLDFYILVLIAGASIGLFVTSISTIKEYRKKINGKE